MASHRQRRVRYSIEPYNVRACGLRLLGLSSSGDDSETYTYIYCIKLPSFQCYTTQKSNPQQQARFPPPFPQQQVAMMNSLFCHDPGGLQELLDARLYTMVKVGISTNPARRLCEIMRGFEEFGAHDTEFSAIRESDSPDDTVGKGKLEDKVVFIKKCRNIGDAESQIRHLIGQQLGKAFQDQFTANLGDEKRSALNQVGMTEWVLINTDLMKAIQQQYRRNWPSMLVANHQHGFGVLFGLCRPGILFGLQIQTGQDFYKQLYFFRLRFYQRSGRIAYITIRRHTDVTIKFPPADSFTYTLNYTCTFSTHQSR